MKVDAALGHTEGTPREHKGRACKETGMKATAALGTPRAQ